MVLETLKYFQLYSHDKNIIHNDLIYSHTKLCFVVSFRIDAKDGKRRVQPMT